MDQHEARASEHLDQAAEIRLPMPAGAIVVTGGGRGIGLQIALRAARGGAPVALINRTRHDSICRIVKQIEAAGGRAVAIAADIGIEEDVLSAFQEIEAALGPIGGLVNNAVFAGAPARLAELRLDELERVFRTNVFGCFLCAREAAKRLSTKNGGQGGGIVSLSSAVAVQTGAPGWVHFAASKGAIETMSRGLAKELAGEGVRVNVVRAGVVATESRLAQDRVFRDRALAQVPFGRMGEPAEVASAVLWLLSRESAYVSGATLDVTGAL